MAYDKGIKSNNLQKCCWNCKHWTRNGGHGSNDWGFCSFISGYKMIDSEHSCEKFEEK